MFVSPHQEEAPFVNAAQTNANRTDSKEKKKKHTQIKKSRLINSQIFLQTHEHLHNNSAPATKHILRHVSKVTDKKSS